ncbi:MAG TPA: GntR family transcriptional regulator [Streptosporangiaceae bacterium]|nr:GntR family transcriptional regulator [Streptosporangiaceae bacterium]
MIDDDAGQPPWMQLAGILRDRIASGEISGRLPSERTLSQEYGLAIGTVRKAISKLRDEGLIVTVRGWGSFTAPP